VLGTGTAGASFSVLVDGAAVVSGRVAADGTFAVRFSVSFGPHFLLAFPTDLL